MGKTIVLSGEWQHLRLNLFLTDMRIPGYGLICGLEDRRLQDGSDGGRNRWKLNITSCVILQTIMILCVIILVVC